MFNQRKGAPEGAYFDHAALCAIDLALAAEQPIELRAHADRDDVGAGFRRRRRGVRPGPASSELRRVVHEDVRIRRDRLWSTRCTCRTRRRTARSGRRPARGSCAPHGSGSAISRRRRRRAASAVGLYWCSMPAEKNQPSSQFSGHRLSASPGAAGDFATARQELEACSSSSIRPSRAPSMLAPPLASG